MRVPAAGGKSETVIELASGESAIRPELLPDGQTILFTVASGSGPEIWESAKVVAQRPGESMRTTILEEGTDGRYVKTGRRGRRGSGRAGTSCMRSVACCSPCLSIR